MELRIALKPSGAPSMKPGSSRKRLSSHFRLEIASNPKMFSSAAYKPRTDVSVGSSSALNIVSAAPDYDVILINLSQTSLS